MSFAERLSSLMEERDVSAYKLSKDTGITQALIGKYKRGINVPSVDKASIIADFFGVSVDYLLGRTDDPTFTIPDYRYFADHELTDEEKRKVDEYVELLIKARRK